MRRFWEDWIGAYEQWEIKPEQLLDLGNGVVFALITMNARPVGSTGSVQMRYAAVYEWLDGLIERCTTYGEIDEGRAAAERAADAGC